MMPPEIQPKAHAVLATLLQDQHCFVHIIGGVEDHVHLAFELHPTKPLSTVIQVIKSESSKWMKEQPGTPRSFSWQKGYGAFSVGRSQVDSLIHYIANQKGHHHQRTFQEEFRGFCEKYGIELDERYVWD